MAASAGTLLVLAGQVGAMAPESAIGAASPVGLQGENIESTMETKTKEILKASVRALAQRRGEEAVALAEAAIESAKAASSTEALDAGLIDYIAKDLNDLLVQMDGRTVLVNGEELVLNTQGAALIPIKTTMIEDVLGLLTNPNIVFLLLSIGVQAILIEISSPGGWAAGTIGVIMVALAIYGLGILPVNWFGLIFLILAFILFILDIKAPTHGALTFAGTATFIAGALILFNSISAPGFPKVSVGLVIGMSVFLGLSFFAIVMVAVRAMKKPIITGRESFAGKMGTALSRLDPDGIVQVAGEQWSAALVEGEGPIRRGERVVVVRVDGLRLIVRAE
jgi:membrane-bound serine protease (ClpP class)